MAQSEVDTKIQSDTQDKKESKSHSVADYLQAPRRKRRSYVVAALGDKTSDFYGGIESFVRVQFKSANILRVKSADDLLKSLRRQILLLVIDDEFVGLDGALDLVHKFKKMSKGNSPPVLFLTRNPEALIKGYGEVLPAFQEGDDYINYTKFGLAHITSRIRAGLVYQYRRRSRRYRIDIELKYHLLSDDQFHEGRVIDLSVHGGLIEACDGHVFRTGEQLKLHLPTGTIALDGKGEFLHVSARVRRVMISGTQAGISFEYITEAQGLAITALVTDIARKQIAKRSSISKAQAGRR